MTRRIVLAGTVLAGFGLALAHELSLVAVLLLALPLVALWRPSKIVYALHQYLIGRLLVVLLVVWVAGSAAMFLIEGERNESFRTLGASSIAILHYLVSGLESKYPVTPLGNAVAILMLTVGVAIVTVFTGTVVTVLLKGMMNIRQLPAKPWRHFALTDHLVIFGWSERVHRILGYLHRSDVRRRTPPIVVVTEDVSKTRVGDGERFRRVWAVEGRGSERSTLERADLQRAATALVLDSSAPGDRYAALVTALAVERTAPEVRSIVEISDPRLVEHARSLAADEIIDTTSLAERLVGQCLASPGLSRVYDELLTFGHRSQEVYVLPLPRRFDGLSVEELRTRLTPRPLVLLGFWTAEGDLHLQPRPGDVAANRPLRARTDDRPGDRVVILADAPSALRRSSFGSLRPPAWRRRLPTHQPGASPMRVPQLRAADSGPTPPTRHLCLCGWGPRGRAVLEQLAASTLVQHQKFRVRVLLDGASPPAAEPEDDDLRFVVGDPTRRRVLETAGVARCDHLLILSQAAGGAQVRQADHRTLVIALAALDLHPDLHVVAEVHDSHHLEHFERLPNTEAVSIREVSEKLMAQAVVSPGIGRVFTELLTATADSNEIYFVPVPERWRGETFRQVGDGMAGPGTPALLLGYSTPHPESGSTVLVLNPSPDWTLRGGVEDWRDHVLTAADTLVVMAYEQPSWHLPTSAEAADRR